MKERMEMSGEDEREDALTAMGRWPKNPPVNGSLDGGDWAGDHDGVPIDRKLDI